ncbi:MAG: DNA primase [Candidatus Margulisbacteria bacterium]|nr:DNA primase [Candidatus Margulisiibacteriota bacterium]
MIPAQTIEEIRKKSDIVKIISEYTPLRKRGRSHLGLCPFHSEKTPSFTVSEEKQLFHCFGCGAGGNVFDFIMQIDNLGFAEAVRELGEKLGIEVEGGSPSGAGKSLRDQLYDLLHLAGKFYQKSLQGPEGTAARDYMKQRRISEETARRFDLGCAPDGWDNLYRYLLSRGADPKLMEQAGLVLERENEKGSYFDRFRGRLQFPIMDTRGRVLGFSGRSLDGKEPKYLNSPDTPVFRKGDAVFGLSTTKEAIKNTRTAILVEGNVDLISTFQAGVHNVVAPLGTALTIGQCKLLARFADTVVLAYDADPAGETAAERSAELIISAGLKVRVAQLSGAKDPDELVQKQGGDALKKALSDSLPYLEFKLKRTLGRHNLKEIEGRGRALKEIGQLLSGETDQFAQKEYAKLAAGALKTTEEQVLAEARKLKFYNNPAARSLRRTVEKPPSRIIAAEKHLLALAAQNVDAREKLKAELPLDRFITPEARQVAALIYSTDLSGAEDPEHKLLSLIEDEGGKRFLTTALLSESQENPQEILHDCIESLREEKLKSRVNALKSELQQAEAAGDTARASELISALMAEIS